MVYGVSACLVGKNTKYDGKNNYNQAVVDFLKDKEYILICPEVMGGLPTPRVPSEQLKDKVINQIGEDVTINFTNGAKQSLELLKEKGVSAVILKERSPSCGYKKIYDGSFSKTLIDGHGVFAKLANENGIKIYTETDIKHIQEKNES